MKKFLENKISIVQDNDLHINEVIAMAIVVVVLLLIILIIVDAIKSYRRKKKEVVIFSHRKNKYKSRLGKKHKY